MAINLTVVPPLFTCKVTIEH